MYKHHESLHYQNLLENIRAQVSPVGTTEQSLKETSAKFWVWNDDSCNWDVLQILPIKCIYLEWEYRSENWSLKVSKSDHKVKYTSWNKKLKNVILPLKQKKQRVEKHTKDSLNNSIIKLIYIFYVMIFYNDQLIFFLCVWNLLS